MSSPNRKLPLRRERKIRDELKLYKWRETPGWSDRDDKRILLREIDFLRERVASLQASLRTARLPLE